MGTAAQLYTQPVNCKLIDGSGERRPEPRHGRVSRGITSDDFVALESWCAAPMNDTACTACCLPAAESSLAPWRTPIFCSWAHGCVVCGPGQLRLGVLGKVVDVKSKALLWHSKRSRLNDRAKVAAPPQRPLFVSQNSCRILFAHSANVNRATPLLFF